MKHESMPASDSYRGYVTDPVRLITPHTFDVMLGQAKRAPDGAVANMVFRLAGSDWRLQLDRTPTGQVLDYDNLVAKANTLRVSDCPYDSACAEMIAKSLGYSYSGEGR